MIEEAILDRLHGRDGIEVACVASNKPDARALERAREAGVETGVFQRAEHPDRASRDAAVNCALSSSVGGRSTRSWNDFAASPRTRAKCSAH